MPRLLSVLLALTPGAFAQNAAAGATKPLPSSRVPVHTRAAEAGQPAYGTWAAGADYKVAFDEDVTFVPYLGEAYPHNLPLRWHTVGVRVGAQDLCSGPTERVQTDYRVEYRRGQVTEAWDVRLDGLEQTFAIAARPAGEGDLVVVAKVATELRAAAAAPHVGALQFGLADGRAVVGYGEARAVDAAGHAFPVATGWDGETLRLVVPAASVAAATYPLVIDPLLSTVNLGTWNGLGEVDIAWDTYSLGYDTLLCHVRAASAQDHDVFAYLSSGTFGGAALVFSDTSTADTDAPRAAFVGGAQYYVIVYQDVIAASQQHVLRVHRHVAADISFGTGTSGHLLPAGVHEWRPDVGGTDSGNTAMVVCQRENAGSGNPFANTATSEIWAMTYDPTTTFGTWGASFQVLAGATLDCERPSVNQLSTDTGNRSWVVVAQAYDNAVAGDDWDLVGRQLGQDGTVRTGSWGSSLGTRHKLAPQVAGSHGRYTVLFAGAAASTGKVADAYGTELCSERFDWLQGAASPTAAGDQPAVTLATNAARVLEPLGLAADHLTRSHWLAVWRAVAPATQPALQYARLGYRGQPTEGPAVLLAPNGVAPGRAAVTQDGVLGEALVLFGMGSGATAQLMGRGTTSNQVAVPALEGTACSAGSIAWHGPAHDIGRLLFLDQQIGGQLFGPSVSLMPANAVHFLVLALATANAPIAHPAVRSGCTLLVAGSGPDYVGILPIAVGGAVSWDLALPESLQPDTLYFQDWVLDPATNQLSATQRLTVPITK